MQRIHGVGLSIDQNENGIKDNALWITPTGNKGWSVTTHISDVLSVISKNSPHFQSAMSNPWGNPIYRYSIFPEGILDECKISSDKICNTITVNARVSKAGVISNASVFRGSLELIEVHTFESANAALGQSRKKQSTLCDLLSLSKIMLRKRAGKSILCGEDSKLGVYDLLMSQILVPPAELIVREMRLLFDHILAQCLAKNRMHALYCSQQYKPGIELEKYQGEIDEALCSDDPLERLKDLRNKRNEFMYHNIIRPTWRDNFSQVAIGYEPYAQFLSPLRRVEDYVNLTQVCYLAGIHSGVFDYQELNEITHSKHNARRNQKKPQPKEPQPKEPQPKEPQVKKVSKASPPSQKSKKEVLADELTNAGFQVDFHNYNPGMDSTSFTLIISQGGQERFRKYFDRETEDQAIRAARRELKKVKLYP